MIFDLCGPSCKYVMAVRLDWAVRSRDGGAMFRYRLHSPDGDDLGEATYAMMINTGEEIIFGPGMPL